MRGLEKRGQESHQAIGRSRGGLSTKIHATIDALGNPTGLYLTPGQAHDLDSADVLLEDTPAATVIADKAYDARARVIESLQRAGKSGASLRGALRVYHVARPGLVQGPPPDREFLHASHKQCHAITTCYDKTASNFLGAIHLASAVAWLI
jgi:transposase